jgi:protease secretion system membrane fusion protein
MQAGKEKLNAVKSELDRTQIKAPVSGQVLGLTLASLGGVVTPGQRLMDIVPDGESLVLDAKVPTHVIDSVHEGGQVFIRFSTFAHTPQLVVEGVIDSLSSDVITEQSSQMAFTYYLARVSLTREGIKQLDGKNLQPGMNAEILIKTGERSLLTYLLHPLSKRITSAMKEE